MRKIVAIQKVKRNKCKYEIELDDGQVYYLLDEFVALKNIYCNKKISDEEIKEISIESEKKEAFLTCVKTLERTLKSKLQIVNKLKEKGFSDEAIDHSIASLVDYNFLNDENFAKSYANTYQNKKGSKLIMFELKNKGITRETAIQATKNIDNNATALKLAEKFMKNRETNKDNLQKLFRHLIYKGFEFDMARKMVLKFGAGESDESWN